MNRSLLQTIVRQAEAFAMPGEAATDADLLARFSATKDETAFAELVRRHGPMVWSVCRQLLPNSADAEDAFQATFLALVRSAATVRSAAALGAWLHGVAVRVATKVKRTAVRRKQRETKVASRDHEGAASPVADMEWEELLAAVHEEVQRLPDVLRTAFVLCDLEGVRQPEAAARLGWKLGTLSGRLTKARQQLLDRLAQRGIAAATACGSVGLGTAVASAAVPSELVGKVMLLAGAPATAPAAILNLALEVGSMWNKTKLLAAAVLVAGGLSFGVGAGLLSNVDAQQPPGGEPPRGGPPTGAPPTGAGGRDPGARPGGERDRGGPGAPGGPGAGVPGAPGQPPGGFGRGGGGGGFGGAASAPVARSWEYKFATKPQSREEFMKLLNDNGEQGWEYAGIADFPPPTIGRDRDPEVRGGGGGGRTEPQHVVVFKRQKFPGGVMGAGGMMGGMGPGGAGGPGGPPMGGATGPVGPPMGGGRGPGAGGGAGAGPAAPGGAVPAGGAGRPGAGGPGMPPQGGAELKMITLKNANAADMVSILTDVFGNRGGLRIVADQRTNTIIVQAGSADIVLIEKLTEALDKPAQDPKRGPGR